LVQQRCYLLEDSLNNQAVEVVLQLQKLRSPAACLQNSITRSLFQPIA
jgi:hypothetical protein